MANNLTDNGERLMLDLFTGNSTTPPVQPLMIRLMATNGSESAAGTELTGTDYEQLEVTFAAASTTSGVSTAKNSVIASWPILDTGVSKSVVGYEIWDSSAIPQRLMFETFTTVVVAANEEARFNINALSIGIE